MATGIASASPDDLIELARTRTGLDDLGPKSYREGLDLLVETSKRAPAPPEPIERQLNRCVDALANRLRVLDYAKAHPEVREERIVRPLIVFGMPRSGTTLVSYLLDQDPHRRSLLQWEVFDTVPPPTPETRRTDPRCLALLAQQEEDLRHDPIRYHVEWANGPTEDLQVHGQDFRGLAWEALVQVPDYSLWLQDCDMSSAYAYQRLVLQILQSASSGVWSLKQPSHALFLDYLLEAFPDARLVWTHRDPYRVTGSVLDLKATNWLKFTGNPAIEILLDYYPQQMGEHVKRPMKVRKRIGRDRIYDLYYADMMRDPIGSLRQMYDWAGDVMTPEAETGMRRWLDENPQDRFGKHEYTLARYGLTKADLDQYFGEYLAEYDVEEEAV